MSPNEELSPVKQALLTLQRQQERIRTLEQAPHQPIAIVGMGLRFPGGADTPQAFWELLATGTDAITPVPPLRWDADALYDPDPDAPGRMTTREGGFCRDVDRFDAAFFRLSPLEARAMDPQQRLLLEVAWEALEDANVVPGALEGSATGVYVGASTTDWFSRQQAQARPEAVGAYTVSGAALSVVAGRLSYLLGLRGPSLSVDTACSSSLTALHLAAQALRSGQCDLALAGGVGLLLTPEPGIAFSKARMLAPDGRCKTFDAAADGYGRGEGCAVLVLKRLADAQAAGDRILAVVRGTAANQNGASGGLTVPSGPAQEAVIRQALADAGATPDDVDYVEAHGTGTALGDPIELRALGQVFGAGARGRPLRVGSVKTNIGHLEAAAGVAGVAKVVLALQHEALPPHLHFERPTPHFPWAGSALEVPTRLAPWPQPRLAGVSSFGFAGSNAHVVLGPAPAAAASPAGAPGPCLLTLSARTPAALAELAARYRSRLLQDEALDLAAFCQAANRCRTRFEQRLAVIGATPQALARLLDGDASGTPRQEGEAPAALLAAARAWLAGETVDWDAVDPVRRPRVGLPTYPFQRASYWYDQADDAGEAPLLARRIDSPFLRALFETPLREDRPAFVGEHRVGGRVVIAAAHWVAMLLQALDAAAPGAGLRELQFLRAATIGAGQQLTTQLGVEAEGAVRIASRAAAGSPWQQHVTGRLDEAPAPAADGATLADVRARCPRPADPQALYAHAAATGIALGPHFRPVVALLQGDDEALAELAGPFDPGVIDGCFQSALATLPALPAQTLVPARIAHLRWLAKPQGERLWCHARRVADTPGEAAGALTCDLRLWDAQGTLCLAIAGFEARAADPATLGEAAPWRDWLYRVDWTPLPQPGAVLPPLQDLPPYTIERWVDRPAVHAYGTGLQALNAVACAYARQALQALAAGPTTSAAAARARGVAERHLRLFGRLQQLAETAPAADADTLAAQAAGRHPAVAGELAVLRRCGEALPQVLRGAADPLELLFPGGDSSALAALYGESAAARCMNGLLAQAVAQAVQGAAAPLRVLEIGAGTGASTAPLLAALQPSASGRALAYSFSDVSPHFAQQARERFGDAIADYRALDIERDPLQQGLAPASFDVVVAANVLHATRDLARSVAHARRLLAPGGLLVLLEGVAPQPWLDLVFGLTTGWWRFEDTALRPAHPLLDPSAWQALLRDGGFVHGTVVSPDRADDGVGLGQAVLLAQAAPEAPAADVSGHWLLLADRSGCAAALADRLQAAGARCTLAWRSGAEAPGQPLLASDDAAGWQALLARVQRQAPVTQVLDLGALDGASAGDVPEAAARACTSRLHLLQALLALPAPPRLAVAFGASEERPAGVLEPRLAPAWGLAKVAALEHPQLHLHRFDLGTLRGAAAAQALWPQLVADAPEPEASLRGGRWHVPRLARHHLPPARPRLAADGSWLVTGAFGGLGLLLAQTLVEDGARDLLLVGRHAPGAAASERLAQLERAGVRVRTAVLDVADAPALQRALAALDAEGVPLQGVFHAAGVLDDALLADQDAARLRAAFAPKVQGAWNLHQLTRHRPLAHFVLYSSAAALLGSEGQASHAAGNAFLDQLALARRAAGLPALSIGWSAWAEIGAAARVDAAQGRAARWQRQGFAPLAPAQATAALRALLADPDSGHVGVVAIDWTRLAQQRPDDPLLAAFRPRAAAVPALAAPTRAQATPQRSLLEQLQAATDTAHRTALLQQHLRAELARILGWPGPEAVDPQASFLALGVDSLTAMELRNRLQAALGCTLAGTLTFDHPSVDLLAAHLASLSEAGAAPAVSATQVADADLDALLLSLLAESK